MFKEEIRLNFTNLRNSLSPEEVSSASCAIAKMALSLPIWEHEYYHIFLSIKEKNEVDTGPILALLKDQGKKVVVPRINNRENLVHLEIDSDSVFEKNRWGIPEPSEGRRISEENIDLVFIPLLAFDRQGHRVGYGKGYYDRFLAHCRPDVLKIGLSFFEAVECITDLNDNDMAMDYCVTPSKIYSF